MIELFAGLLMALGGWVFIGLAVSAFEYPALMDAAAKRLEEDPREDVLFRMILLGAIVVVWPGLLGLRVRKAAQHLFRRR